MLGWFKIIWWCQKNRSSAKITLSLPLKCCFIFKLLTWFLFLPIWIWKEGAVNRMENCNTGLRDCSLWKRNTNCLKVIVPLSSGFFVNDTMHYLLEFYLRAPLSTLWWKIIEWNVELCFSMKKSFVAISTKCNFLKSVHFMFLQGI